MPFKPPLLPPSPEKYAVDPPELLAATRAVAGGRFKIAAALCCYSVLLWLLRMWLEAEVAVVVDFGLRRKGLCDAFGLWNCVLRVTGHRYPLMATGRRYPLMATGRRYPLMATGRRYPLMATGRKYPLMIIMRNRETVSGLATGHVGLAW
ncbi:uncharacterized protein [Arachis hypogaea]|uniref:uncharacterized protein n=1 Tax=Arachis hypogaea TaxID=3818 RepID=UPI003B20E4B5